ncbi:glycoside hydrolase domain-containing protein [Corynebacterium provencense]|uniref:glycoside hydrolase domain-containing protein n=1 Tax=Corynebacterium provencense TaxID=1737425 RepID=UPI000A632536|nr:glycoside hydrolase domain-containing protein [Corynebacterium provencense]
MATVIDFSAAFPKAADIKAAGHEGVVAYVSPPRELWMKAKPLTKAVADAYRAAGLKIGAVWQYGGAGNPDVLRGAAGGRADALAADAQLKAVGLAGHPVFFAVDFDITLAQWNATAVQYFRSACDVLGRQRVGIYGHSRAVAWAQEDGVVADLGGGRCLGWVTSSWSQGDKAADYAVLYQGTHNVPGPSGVQVDINTVYASEWGHRPIPTPTVDLTKLPRVDQTLWLNKHYTPGRGGRRIKYIVRHHNAGILSIQGCWNVWQTREASAHYQVETTGRVGQLVRDEDTAWHAADQTRNQESIGIEHANSAGAAQDWPISDATITAGAHLAAELCIKHDLGRPEFGKNIRDHKETGATACPYHLAAGGKYHEKWMRAAQAHYDTLTKPAAVVAQEDDMFTDYDREALLDVRAMLQTLCAQDMGDPGVTGPYGGWPQTGGRTRTDILAAIAAKLGITGTTDTKEA